MSDEDIDQSKQLYQYKYGFIGVTDKFFKIHRFKTAKNKWSYQIAPLFSPV